jgi:adenylate cyclase
MDRIYAFGPFRLDGSAEILFRDLKPLPLGRRAIALLRTLVGRAGVPVSKDALIEAAWPGLVVEESNLTVQIASLRRALGEEPGGEYWIETLPRRGYRFVGPKVSTPEAAADATSPGPKPPGAEPNALPDKPSILVLPFTNISDDLEQEYFANGLTADLITELSRISSMAVIAYNSLHKVNAIDVKQLAADFGCRYVLEGTVRRAGQHVRVTAQLIEATTGNHLWAEKYDRGLEDIFAVQDEITRSVVGSTQTQVVLSEGAFAERSTKPDFRSWDLAKRGWKKIYELTRDSLEAARDIARELTEIDPSFAKGQQLLAAAEYHLALMGFSDDQDASLSKALRGIKEAIRLDGGDEYSHWLLGAIAGNGLGQHDRAVTAFRQALELNPNFSLAIGSLGFALALAGKVDESIRNSEFCIRLNPRDPSVFFRFSSLALAYFVGQDYSRARDWAEKAVARKYGWWQGHALLAASCAFLNVEDDARAAVRDLLRVIPSVSIGHLPPIPFKNPGDFHRLQEGLRNAGLR